ncbi:glycosyltransferase [Coraliomargarita sp. SDUM461004]|uniref:Glycosyltransferase n=1 Tax=Thalassobacterium sedimentorum TaxID=3041258 RepID=A0ABU1AHN3_9BACT|nr:glycosyltransferase [Coraliomargarita sp. SDUM461004]MDQ8193296.1 glycosyltransferase [Coraliomargarita sp. SDUM461004]
MKVITLMVPTMDGGGSERAVLLLANYWASEGCDVRLILFRRTGVLLSALHPNVRIHSLNSRLPWIQVWRLIRYLKEQPADNLLCVLNAANAVGILARLFGRIHTRIIATVHNHMGAKYAHTPSLLNPFRKLVIGWMLRRADRVVVVSKMIQDYLVDELNLAREKTEVIYNPVDLSLTKQALERPEHPYFQQSVGPVIIAAGRLTRQKNFQLLVRAMSNLSENIRLVILGEGEDRPELEGLIQQLNLTDRVSLPGFKDQPLAWFKWADCYVMSSDWEGFPFVLLEAMSMGLQIVSTDCPSGPAELLDHGSYGRLVPCADAAKLADAILLAVREPMDADRLRGRSAEFNIQKVAEHYAMLLA